MDKVSEESIVKNTVLDILKEIDCFIKELGRVNTDEVEALFDLKAILRKKYWSILHEA